MSSHSVLSYLYGLKCEQLLLFFFILCIAFCFVFQSEILHAKQNSTLKRRKLKDGSEYEPDSLRVMEASIDRYLRQMNYPDSIISGRPLKPSQETLNSKAKLLWYQGKGKRPTVLSLTIQWTKTFSRSKVN